MPPTSNPSSTAPPTLDPSGSPYDPALFAGFEPIALAVDVVLLTLSAAGSLQVLLVCRDHAPEAGAAALPGVIVRPQEQLEAAAQRALLQKGGVSGMYLEQLYTFGRPDRDPRLRVVSVAYLALCPAGLVSAEAGVTFTAVTALPTLAFDHSEIVSTALERLRGKVDYTDVALRLLPERFTLREAQGAWEAILGAPENKDSFRRSLVASGLVRPLGERQSEVGHRPAELYTRADALRRLRR